MTWQPVTQPPSEVGRYVMTDEYESHSIVVQWDGRNFRFVSGECAGDVVCPFKGDQWRSP